MSPISARLALTALALWAGIPIQARAQGLTPTTPAKEYIRLNGQIVAIENNINSGVASRGQASATFIGTDATTQGSWKGVYGRDGEMIDSDTHNPPSYASVAISGASDNIWGGANPTSDVRALEKAAAGAGRFASCWYTNSNMTIDVNLTDGNTHQVALYWLDWDEEGRVEQVQVQDAVSGTVLDMRSAASFQNGEYLIWALKGHVTLNIALTSGVNAVVSGLFFGPAGVSGGQAAASFIGTDTTTQGSWKNVYGGDGEMIDSDTPNSPSSYASVTINGASDNIWAGANPTSDVRALEKAVAGAGRFASCWYTNSSMSIDVNLTDGNTHQVALYWLDWDEEGRAEQVQVLDAVNGTTLDTRSVSGFQNGKYLIWNLRGHVTLNITLTSGVNAVVSGLFFGPAAAATFIGTDAMTQGSWKGVYGGDGEMIDSDTPNPPSYASVGVSGASDNIWGGANPTSDVRALEKAAAGAGRFASCWYTNSNMTIDVNLTDGNTHQVALYWLDWDSQGRMQQVEVLDAVSGAALDTRSVSGFQNGKYLIWNLKGHVKLNITLTSGVNAVVSGLFFGPAATASFVGTDTMTQGSWKGIYGLDGEMIDSDTPNPPSYASVGISGASDNIWAGADPTSDVRALEKAAAGAGRFASCWYSNSSMNIDVNLTDGNTHQVALYWLDWDEEGRVEQVQVRDAVSGTVLDVRSVSSFQNGEYLIWALKGHVTLNITLTSGVNAVVSGLFFR